MDLSTPLLNESKRLAVLRQYDVLDSPSEQALDDLVALAAQICDAPIALITLIDGDRQWFKSRVGVEMAETPRDLSFCAHALQQTDLLIVPDATKDERFAQNPLVSGEPHICFYAGAPLISPDGAVLGTLCIVDHVARTLSPVQEQTLRVLSRQVMTHLELRRQGRQLAGSERLFQTIFDVEPECVKLLSADGRVKMMNEAGLRIIEAESFDQIAGRSVFPLVAEEHRPRFIEMTKRVFHGESGKLDFQIISLQGKPRWLETHVVPLRGENGEVSALLGISRDITEQHTAEQALEEKSFHLHAALKVADLGVWYWNIRLDAVVMLHPCGPISGLPPEAAPRKGSEFLALVHPEDRAVFNEQIQRAQAGKEFMDEFRIVLPDGAERWVAVRGRCLPDGAGELVILTGVDMDITERKQSEVLRWASDARYRSLFESAADGILIATGAGRYLDANASVCRMLGYTRTELTALEVSDIVAVAERPLVQPALAEILAGSTHHREWEFVRKDGAVLAAEVMGTLMPDGNVLATIRDITERKRSEARFRWLVDSNAQGVMFWKNDGAITGANDAFLKLIGYSREDLEAGCISWTVLTPEAYAGLDRRAFADLATTGICAPYEKEFIRKDRTTVPLLIGAALFPDHPEEGVCFTLDLTERKRLEQQFLRAQRMESIGTLAGGIAHDLNNSLGPIMTSIELLQMQFDDPQSQQLLAIIEASARRGADMVRQLLSFARGLEGRRMEVQIKHLALEIQQIVRDTFLKHIQLRTIVPNNLRTVMGDPTQLHQVLLNLCMNARDAMPYGGAITLSAKNVELDEHYAALNPDAQAGSYVLLRVEDSGTGIPPEILERIFDPFFTTKDVGKGTGLGLSTALGIIKSHGGFLRVESTPGKGTTFEVYLPAPTETLPTAVAPQVPELPRGHGELILVVDDEVAVREITQRTLESFGYRVALAVDGTEAVTTLALEGEGIAAVITDMTMPVMDGVATIHVLRKMRPRLPIAAASGLPADPRLAELGVTHFLPKPYTAADLLKVVDSLLR